MLKSCSSKKKKKYTVLDDSRAASDFLTGEVTRKESDDRPCVASRGGRWTRGAALVDQVRVHGLFRLDVRSFGHGRLARGLEAGRLFLGTFVTTPAHQVILFHFH